MYRHNIRLRITTNDKPLNKYKFKKILTPRQKKRRYIHTDVKDILSKELRKWSSNNRDLLEFRILSNI